MTLPRRTFVLLSILAIISLIWGCQNNPGGLTSDSQVSQSQESVGKIKIVTSFYPLYELAKQIGGEKVVVKNIVPAGSEPHDYEPTPLDIVDLQKADLLIINGAGLEPWVNKLLPDLEKRRVKIIDESKAVTVLQTNNENQQNADNPFDPHFWLDPLNFLEEGRVITAMLSQISPENSAYFEKNAQDYFSKLQNLDKDFVAALANCKQHEFVTSHAAFSYLARRYNLTMIAITGISPDAEPEPKKIAELSLLLKAKNIKVVFTEPLVSSKIAKVIADETGASVMTLNPLEGLTNTEIQQGKNYLEVMKDNQAALKIALQCE